MTEELENANRVMFENNQVRSVQLDLDSHTLQYSLLLKLAADEKQEISQALYFHDVQGFELRDFGGGLVQFMNLHIEKSELGHDRQRFSVEDREHAMIRFNCSGFDLL